MAATSDRGKGARDPLEIVSEHVMVAIPRGDEELRVAFTKARTSAGKDVAWHSLRVFYKTDAGEWRPGKQGITIRGGELRAVADALAKATSGGPTAQREAARPPNESPKRASASNQATDEDIPF